MKYEARSGKDLARALAKLSPGGMNEFVQSVPVNVAGFLMRSAAQSAPLRLWPTEYDPQDDVSNRGGPAAIEACGWRFQVPEWKPGQKGCFERFSLRMFWLPVSKAWPFFLQENPPLPLKDLQVLWQVLCCVAGMGMVEDGVWVLVSSHLLVQFP